MLYIHGARVFTPFQQIDRGAVLIDGPRIVALGPEEKVSCPADAERIDSSGLVLAPGFIDLQLNGAFGHDFTANPESIWTVASRLPQYGVTAFLPTIITTPLETISTAQEIVARTPASVATGAIPLGLHVEGPFLNPGRTGAHNPAYLRLPDLAATRYWSPERGVKLVTLAPELPGALDLVASLSEQGVLVGAGHSLATYEQAQAGFDAGIRYGTHLFNAMPALYHREPGLVAALLTDPRLTVGLIADGIHTHPSIVSLVWQFLGSARLNLVTDGMAALGMSSGRHLLGDLKVETDESSARLADGTLAGSILSLDTALRNLIAFAGCSLQDALPTVTSTPAASLGILDQRGQLSPGLVADLVLLSSDLDVTMTIASGDVVYVRES